jgi:hypothetical protein
MLLYCLIKSCFVQDDKDFMYEEQVLKDPFQVKSWLHYLEAKRDSAPQVRSLFLISLDNIVRIIVFFYAGAIHLVRASCEGPARLVQALVPVPQRAYQRSENCSR